MLSCDSCQILMADALYEQLDAMHENRMRDHLQGCADCQAIMQELAKASEHLIAAGLSSGIFSDIPEPAALDGIWDQLEASLDKIDAARFRQSRTWGITPLVATATAIAASVVLFISVNLVDRPPSESPPEIVAGQSISPALMDYLNRAQVMLLLVANAESDNVSIIPINNSFARDMALEASFLNTSMDDSLKSGQRKLLRDVEFLLLQIANLDESNMAPGVALLQSYLQQNSVLFKIRLLEMRDQQVVI